MSLDDDGSILLPMVSQLTVASVTVVVGEMTTAEVESEGSNSSPSFTIV